MNETPKNREWVKNAAIVFLAVLLVLTFFSNTIMNRSLPEVATQDVTDGAIVSKVRGSGTVTANGNNQVKMEKTRVIRAVLVKAGQEVQAGDVLFTLGEGSSEEIEALEEKIRNLQNSYNRTAVSGQVYTNYSNDERMIDNRLAAWENAMDRLAYVESKVAAEAATDAELQAAKDRLDIARALMDAAGQSYEDELAEKQANLDEVRANVEAETARQISDVDSQINAAEPQQQEYEVYAGLVSEVELLKTQIQDNETRISALNDRKLIDLAEKYDLERRQTDLEGKTDPESIAEYEANNKRLEELRIAIDAANTEETDLRNDTDAKNTKKNNTQAIIDSYTTIPTDQSELIAELYARLYVLQSEGAGKELIDEAIDALNKVSGTTYQEAKVKYDAALAEYNTLVEAKDPLLNYEYQQAQIAYDNAEDAYYNAVSALDQKQASDWRSQAATGVDLNATMQELDVAKKKLAELTGTDGENITAKVAGTVTSVECNAGDKKMKDDVLCTIEVPDQGYTLSFTATNEQASRLRIGDQATVSNFYWGNEVTATLSSIKTDPKNPQNNKLLTFDLEGNVTSGSQLTISVGSKSANYDLIIPSSAIRSDSNGSFVLKVEAKNSPLGNRYIAKRVPVEVLASDDNNSAVTAELQYGDYVITTSSAPIKNGSMVRLANAS